MSEFDPYTHDQSIHIDMEGKPWQGKLENKLGPEVRDLADVIEHFISTNASPLTISVEGEWGTGKSFFLTNLALQMANHKDQRFLVVRYNAWEKEMALDPLLAFVHEVYQQLKDFPKMEKPVESLKAFGIVVNEFISGVTGFNAQEAVKKADKKAKPISRLDERLDAVKNFKGALKGLAGCLNDQEIVIFIDELDRCRPLYALELLESIKHLMQIPGLVFVIGADRQQLEDIIGVTQGTDKERRSQYLQRLIRWRFYIPIPDTRKYTEFLSAKYGLEKALDQHCGNGNASYKEVLQSCHGTIISLFSGSAAVFPIELRSMERLMQQLVITIQSFRRHKEMGEFAQYLAAIAIVSVLLKLQVHPKRKFHENSIMINANQISFFEEGKSIDMAFSKISNENLIESDSVRVLKMVKWALSYPRCINTNKKPHGAQFLNSFFNISAATDALTHSLSKYFSNTEDILACYQLEDILREVNFIFYSENKKNNTSLKAP